GRHQEKAGTRKSMNNSDESQAVSTFIEALHACWPSGDLQALEGFYHEHVVLLPPDLGPPIQGRASVVDSYREFLGAAELERFEVTAIDVFSFPASSAPAASGTGTHMAHVAFDIDYRLDEEAYREQGLEVYTIQEQGGRLKIIWRQQIVLDSRVAAKAI
ncbi:MAG: nuclear transport factor 2 family protein, partial [Pseudomonadota bacterium]